MTDTVIPLDSADDPAIAALIETAYHRSVDIEVAARHLWSIDREAARLAAPPAPVRHAPRGRRVVVAALTSALLVTSSSAAVAASSHTVPGDLLYGLKRTVERARLLTAVTPEADARVLLDIARVRLEEAQVTSAISPELAADLVDEALVALSGVDPKAAAAPALRASLDGLRQEASAAMRQVAGTVSPERAGELAASAGPAGADAPVAPGPGAPGTTAGATAPGAPPESPQSPDQSGPAGPVGGAVLPTIPDRAPPPPPAPETGTVTSGEPSPAPQPSDPTGAEAPPSDSPSPAPGPSSSPSPSPAPGTGFSDVAPTAEPSPGASPSPSPKPSPEPSGEPSPSADQSEAAVALPQERRAADRSVRMSS